MIVGSGYVGLVSGACFAELGHDVVCVDRDHDKIAALRAGRTPIFEPGLDQLIARNYAAGRIRFEALIELAGAGVEAVFIAVGTPPKSTDSGVDLSAVYSVSAEVAASAHLVAAKARGRVIHDLRNILDRDSFAEAGFTVYGVGRSARWDGPAGANHQRSQLTLEPAE